MSNQFAATVLESSYLPEEGGPRLLEFVGDSFATAHASLMSNLEYVVRSYGNSYGVPALSDFFSVNFHLPLAILNHLEDNGVFGYSFDGFVLPSNKDYASFHLAISIAEYLLKVSPWSLVESSEFLEKPFQEEILHGDSSRPALFQIEFAFDFQSGFESMKNDHPMIHHILAKENDFVGDLNRFIREGIMETEMHPFLMSVSLVKLIHPKVSI